MSVKSGSAVRSLLVCVAGVAVILSVGCNDAEKNRPSTTMPVSRHPNLGLREVPDYLKGTIFERADMKDIAPFRVSGYGLVAGLRGTGDNSAIPQRVREYMIKEMLKNGFASHNTGMQDVTPEMVLRDPRFAVVQVDGLIPPGARENDRFDIYVSAMEESYTRSLSHGTLYTTSLRIMGANPRNPSGSVNTYAMAAGPVFVNPAYALTSSKSLDSAAQSSLRYGVVMDGGIATTDNALRINVRDPQYSTSRAIERRINERFQDVADKVNVVGYKAMAAAVDDGIVKVYVPRVYAGDWQHFAGVVKHLYLRGEPGYLAQMAQKLADAAAQPEAPLENISYAWEGIGAPAEPVLRKLMHDPKPEVAYAAARAAAFTFLDDQEEPRNVLMTMARTPDHPFRVNAVRTLAAMATFRPDGQADPETSQAVRQLLDSDNNMVRIEAYKALVKGHDARVFTKVVQEKFALDLVPSSGAPLIYASSRGIPRIAVFGMRQSMVTPVTFSAFDARLTLTAEQAGGPVTLFYRSERAAGDRSTGAIKQQSRPDLPELLARLGGEAGEDEKKLDFSYSDVVALLQVLHKSDKLVGTALDGSEVPITLVIEEGSAQMRDAILSAPQIPETERMQNEGDDVSAPQIPDTESPAAPAPATQPAGKGRVN